MSGSILRTDSARSECSEVRWDNTHLGKERGLGYSVRCNHDLRFNRNSVFRLRPLMKLTQKLFLVAFALLPPDEDRPVDVQQPPAP